MNRSLPIFPLLLISLMAGCSSQDAGKSAPGAASAPTSGVMMAQNRKHPLAKYLEVVGFRPLEKSQGKLTIKFGIVNHSDADISDLGLNIGLKPTTAKPDDAPFCAFSVKVPSLAPQEIANVSGECTTTLRVYELPDWQFIRATYEITSPQM
jgi:hypothetical protein